MRTNPPQWFRDCTRAEYQRAWSKCRQNFHRKNPIRCRTAAEALAHETLLNSMCSREFAKFGPRGTLP